MSGTPDLRVRVGGVELPTPVLVASGTFGYGSESPALTRAGELGGIVTKTLTIEPRRGNPPLRLHETPAGLLNSIGLQNVGVIRFCEEKLPLLRELGIPIIASIGGRVAEEFVRAVEVLEESAGIVAYEINVSCPNVKEGGIEFCQRPESAAEVVRAVRASTRRALWIKLSPNVSHIGQVAAACAETGADAFTAVNTFVGLSVDVRTRQSHLPGGTGGVSGPAIRPLALAKVRETVRATALPVIGCGGIATTDDALQFLVVGARAVQVGTASFRVPDAAARVQDGIRAFLAAEGRTSVEEIIRSYQDPMG